MAASRLVLEQRRHWRISFGLMSICLVSGVAVTNERGLFVPIGDFDKALAATVKAFAAISGPPGGRLDWSDIARVTKLTDADTTVAEESSGLVLRDLQRLRKLTMAEETRGPDEEIASHFGTDNPGPGFGGSALGGQAQGDAGGSGQTQVAAEVINSVIASTPTELATIDTPVAPPTGQTDTPASQLSADPVPGVGPLEPVVTPPPPTGLVPEPSSWGMMITGFGLIGALMRRTARRKRMAAQSIAA